MVSIPRGPQDQKQLQLNTIEDWLFSIEDWSLMMRGLDSENPSRLKISSEIS